MVRDALYDPLKVSLYRLISHSDVVTAKLMLGMHTGATPAATCPTINTRYRPHRRRRHRSDIWSLNARIAEFHSPAFTIAQSPRRITHVPTSTIRDTLQRASFLHSPRDVYLDVNGAAHVVLGFGQSRKLLKVGRSHSRQRKTYR
jgi:hypothetical protein